jgi:CelD/BcsL family acetyltransferase involved in cellulose biosynthesis
MPDVIEINSLEEMRPFQLCWRSLLQQTAGASFFQSWEWLDAYWRHFGATQKLRVLVVGGLGSPLGIVPLVVRREPTRVGWLRVITYPLHDWSTYYGPLGPHRTATLTAAFRYLAATPRDWDLLDLRWTNREIDHGRTPLAMEFAGFPSWEQTWKTTPIVQLNSTWEDYLATRGSRFRHNLRRSARLAARLGRVRYERLRPAGAANGDGDPRWDVFDELQELAGQSWQGSSHDGTTLSHDEVRGFLRDVHQVAARAGAVDMNLLRIDGRLAAFTYNYIHAGGLQGLRTGYHPDFARISPGSLLLARSVEDSCRRGDQHLDLGADPASYKHRWSTRTETSYRYTHYASGSPRGQILRLKHRLWPQTG